MAAFDWTKLLLFKKYLLWTLSRPRLVQTRHHYLLWYFDVKQIEAVFRRCSSNRCSYKFWKLQCWSIFLIKLQACRAAILLKKTPTQMFSCQRQSLTDTLQNSSSLKLCNIHRKTLWNVFLTKLQAFRPAILIKRDSNTGVFQWILRNF